VARPPRQIIALTVNGERRELAVEPRMTLLEALRYALELTGSKQGCDKGDCGACTVLLDGRPTLSCISLAMDAVGHPITTIEGLARGTQVHPVQDAFDASGALQCGFCQSGMMISAAALLEQNARPSRDEIKDALSGNLCRCTGYTQIVKAVEVASGQRPVPEP
jgi:carbon-monoxide dehydrogenase small subunit